MSEIIVAAIGVTLELTSTEWSEEAIQVAEQKLAAYPEADVMAALDRCQNEVARRLRMADIIERLPRRPSTAGTLDAYGQGYRDGLFGKDRRKDASPDWITGYERGVEERQARRSRLPPIQRHHRIASRRVGTFKRPEIPEEVRALLPGPPRAGERSPPPAPARAARSSEPAPVETGMPALAEESTDDLLEIPPFLRRAAPG